MRLQHTRREPAGHRLDEADLDPDPIKQFHLWLHEALVAELHEPHAMTLATASPDSRPSARIVLLRGLDERGFVFYTSYEGQKAEDLAANPQAALVFYWAELDRQVRVEGRIEKTTPEESDAYFHSRPAESRLAACAVRQSEVIPSREYLVERWRELAMKHPDGNIPRPPTWGGYRLIPHLIEFWQSGLYRLHDRLRYTRTAEGWVIQRLAP